MRRAARDGNGRDGQVRRRYGVLRKDVAKIHAVKLVAAEDQRVIEIVVQKMNEVLAHGVGGALIPGGVSEGLFRRQDFHEAAGEMVEFVRLRNVPVQRSRVELGEQIDAAQTGVDAVGDRDIHQPVFAGQRHGRLGALAGDRKQTGALAATHDDGKHVAGVGRHARAV